MYAQTVVPEFFFSLYVPTFFLLGLVIGSFLNVLIFRTQSGERVTGRSHCTVCQTTLHWYELVPLFSYLWLRGRCRSCKTHISLQYPLVELTTGLLFALVLWVHYPLQHTPYNLSLLVLDLALWSLLMVITVYDLKTKLIPDRFSYTFAGLALFSAVLTSVSTPASSLLLTPHSYLLTHLLAGPLLFLPFYILWYTSDGRWIGLGDGKLALGIGFLLGPVAGLSAVVFSFWIGATVSLLLIAFSWLWARRVTNTAMLSSQRKRLTLKSEVPFGPFLVLGTLVVYTTGWTIVTLFI